MAGIFISRGMTVGIPPGGLILSVDEQGQLKSSLTLHVRFDVCPTWLELALRHLDESRTRQMERIEAWKSKDDNDKAMTLEKEFESSMQSIMCAAIALDAYYAIVSTMVEVPAATKTIWREKRTARYAQIVEVLRMAFTLKPKGFGALRQNLREIYRLRDLAVHPSGKIEAPILHPELNVGVEWRFAWFRYENALIVVRETVRMLFELSTSAKPKNEEIGKYAASLASRIRPLHDFFSSAVDDVAGSGTNAQANSA